MRLLTLQNPKLLKDAKDWYLVGLSLSPARTSGVADVCAWSTRECQDVCIHWAGRGQMPATRDARVERTRLLKADPTAFCDQLIGELAAVARKADREGRRWAARLNVYSDLPWERVQGGRVVDAIHDMNGIAYDYTKAPVRARSMVEGLAYSYTGRRGSWSRARSWLAIGRPVAVVFRHDCDRNPSRGPTGWELPRSWRGVTVEDGDVHDRVFERGPVVLGLRAKGKAKLGGGAFVVDATTTREGC